MSLKKAAKNALQCQSACNLSGVVRSFARDMDAICEALREEGTDAWNTHPVVKLYVTQLLHLSFGQAASSDQYHKAYETCIQLSEQDEE